MTKRIFVTMGSFALLAAGSAFAQSAAVMQANIPFEFRVGKTVLPAGHYQVRPEFEPGVLSIRCYDECKASVMAFANPLPGRAIPQTGKLVFNRYGNTYFLSTVLTPGFEGGRQLPESAAEREVARHGSALPAIEVAAVRH